MRASESDIKKAFFKLAKTYHPDHNKAPGAKEKFTEILEAYDILSDDQKKKIYDTSGLTSYEQENLEFEENIYFLPGFYKEELDSDLTIVESPYQIDDKYKIIWEELNKKFYGSPPDYKRNMHIQPDNEFNIVTELSISFFESINGCQKKVKINRHIICEECKGKGIMEEKEELKEQNETGVNSCM